MVRIKIDVEGEFFDRLADRAFAERRPIPWQAEVELRRAVGLPFPAVPGAHHESVTRARGPKAAPNANAGETGPGAQPA
jgi:hypothetical protein